MRIGPQGIVYQQVNIELPAELHRRLEIEKNRRRSSYKEVLLEWIIPQLQALPPSPEQEDAEG